MLNLKKIAKITSKKLKSIRIVQIMPKVISNVKKSLNFEKKIINSVKNVELLMKLRQKSRNFFKITLNWFISNELPRLLGNFRKNYVIN